MEQLTNTEMFDRNIRVQCLKLVMENGSNLDRAGPVEKAKGLYAWVTGTTDEAPDDPEEEQFGQPFGLPTKDDLKGSGKAPKK